MNVNSEQLRPPSTLTTQSLVGWIGEIPSESSSAGILKTMAESLDCDLEFADHHCGPFSAACSGLIQSSAEGLVTAIIGEPGWKQADLLAIAGSKGPQHALAAAYRLHGADLCDVLTGDYSFLIYDRSKNLLLAGVDRFARYPLYFSAQNQRLVFATSANAVKAHPACTQQINLQGIYEYVYFHMVPSPGSIHSGLQKLAAGHLLYCDNGNIHLKRYWKPDFSRSGVFNPDDAGQKLRQVLKDSVSRSIGDSTSIGSFLSGGLDSSTVTGFMAELTECEAEAYSIGFSAEGYDEMAYARITAQHFGVRLNEYYVTPEDVVDALPDIATSYEEPFGNSSALPAWFCARLAAENGVHRLLGGDGGDELFAGNERYAKQQVFEDYQKFPGFLRSSIVEPIVSSLSTRIPLASKAKSYIAQAKTPLPDRLQSYNFLHRHAADEIFREDFLKAVDERSPERAQRAVYTAPEAATTLDRMLFLDWYYTLADNDLRKVSQMCSKAGVEVMYPMLDDELLDFSCRIPDEWKLRKGDLRYFYKRSLADWLPRETITKTKQGFGLPFGVWMQSYTPLQELAYESLLQLKRRDYFQDAFLDKAIELHRDGHAAYYGELVWILTVLELWLAGRPQLESETL